MNINHRILLTDLYQLTMAYGYWKHHREEEEAVFHLFFRKNPFGGGFAVAAGLPLVMEYLQDLRFEEEDCRYLARLTGNDGKALFDADFLQYLQDLRFTCEVDAVPEGTLVFPHTPLLRIKGPLLQAQLLETAMLNLLNFSTLIATKAARIKHAAGNDPVLEFGLRRAQGADGGLSASRAAYIGGCDATSNVLAGFAYDIPVKGTHAHSWVMSFPDEATAFTAYAEAMPNNGIFLVDTYDTLAGVQEAIVQARKLREKGHNMVGIRLDSGDLAALSIEARRMLDAAGFPDTKIVASNDLDEYTICYLKQSGAKIDIWGVGTRLVTAFDQPALGGVYKLSALRSPNTDWQYTMKFSNQPIKNSLPGILQTRRFFDDNGSPLVDLIYHEPAAASLTTLVPLEGVPFEIPSTQYVDLLIPVFRQGKLVYQLPDIHETRARVLDQLQQLSPAYRSLKDPAIYPLGISPQLQLLRQQLAQQHHVTLLS